MTVRVQRTFELPVAPERVWEFIVDPGKRAGAISVVSDYELTDSDGRTATWYIDLPIPVIDRQISVETEDLVRNDPEYVKFVGRSRAMRVVGEHRIEDRDGQRTFLHNEFVVEGRLPGVERFFRRNLDRELDNLERALRADLGLGG